MKFHTLILMLIMISCVSNDEKTEETQGTKSYNEKYRPQYHFTPAANWMNDPNGMVYYEGEYHLFYQYYPDSTVWGPMHWGHAVSPDMMAWEHLPIALYPDKNGYIFSGSAVIDWENTSGFGSEGNPDMVAIFTYHDPAGYEAGNIDFQTQGIAYSLDKGRSWKVYENNPVLANPGIIDFRDPKVSWVDEIQKWMMILAVKDHVEFYSSPNLIDWSREGEFGRTNGAHGGVWECPDLFKLTDQNGVEKWVLLLSINPGGPQGGSATQYFVGEYDGKEFTPQDTITRWIDHGADNYAGVTWSDVPEVDGRRLFIGWMSNWNYANIVPTESWRSAMTLPRELILNATNSGFELHSKPVVEIESYHNLARSFTGSTTVSEPIYVIDLEVENAQDFSVTLSNEMGEQVVINAQNGLFSFDRSKSGIVTFEAGFGAKHEMDFSNVEIKDVKIYADLASIEVFINNGERVITEIVFPNEPYQNVKLEGAFSKSEITTLKKVW